MTRGASGDLTMRRQCFAASQVHLHFCFTFHAFPENLKPS